MGEGAEKQEQPLVCGLMIYSPNLKNVPTLRQENWNQFSDVNVFMLGCAMCVKLRMWKWWLQVWVPKCGKPHFCSHKCAFCCCNLICLWALSLLFKPLLHPTCSYSKWMLHTVHFNSSKVSKVLFFSICSRWLELAGRSSRDPCQILMSSVLAFDPLSPLFPGWLLSNSITFSLRQQEIVCSYSRYPSVKANVQSSAQVPVPSQKTVAALA